MNAEFSSERTSFVGRQEELSLVDSIFGGGTRLLTVVGPAGAGKTRFARRYAQLQLEKVSGRAVRFVDLTASTSAEDIVAGVRRSLQIPAADDTTMAAAVIQLGHALAAGGATLLIFDNFDRLGSHAAATLGVWLEKASETRILVTSREWLRLGGEACLELRPLPSPDALRLFEERARLVKTDFRLDGADHVAAQELVTSLDGNPLAIELAAARVNVLPPRKLLERISARLDLLRTTRKDTTERHSSLRAAIDGSWDLLDRREREALAQCSVFRGGFSLEAAEAILVVPESPTGVAIDLLEALLSKSLLFRERALHDRNEPRFNLYETIRAYGYERLRASESFAPTLRRHAEYYLRQGESWIDESVGSCRPRCEPLLSLEVDNLFAILRSPVERDPDVTARAALCLGAALAGCHPSGTLLQMIEAAFQEPSTKDDRLRVRLLYARGHARRLRGLLADAQTDLQQALALARQIPHPIEAAVLSDLASVYVDGGELADAEACAMGALEVAQRFDISSVEARTRNVLGIVHLRRGQRADAEAEFSRALAAARQVSDRQTESFSLGNLGKVLSDCARNDEAEKHYEASLRLLRALGDRRTEAGILGNLGRIEHDRGNLPGARSGYDAALVIHREFGNLRFENVVVDLRALLDLEEGRLEDAEAALSVALAAVRTAKQRPIEGFLMVHLAAMEASVGRIGAAAARFEAVRRQQNPSYAPEVLAVADILEALLEIAHARFGQPPNAAPEGIARHLALARGCLSKQAEAGAYSFHVRVAKRIVRRALAEHDCHAPPAAVESAAGLAVGEEARWFRLRGGARVDLSRRGGVRRILLALVRQRVERADRSLSVDDLFEAGWPGERVPRDAGVRRVYTSIGVLRDLGLRDAVVSRDDGYRLAAEMRVEYPANPRTQHSE